MFRILKLSAIKMRGTDVTNLQKKLVALGFLKEFINNKKQIDGIFGSGTADAVKAWQKSIGKPQDGIVTEAYAIALGIYTPPALPKSKHYSLSDFNICQRDNYKSIPAAAYWQDCPASYYPTVQKVFDRLEKLWEFLNKEYAQPDEEIRIYIYCGYRCKAYNTAMQGATHSEHMDAEAVDVYTLTVNKVTGQIKKRELNNYQLAQAYLSLFPTGGAGLGDNLIVHLDFKNRRYWYGIKSWDAWAKSQTSSKRRK